MYFWRTSLTWKFRQLLSDIDAVFQLTLQQILNVQMFDDVRTQVSLRVGMGGHELERVEKLALPIIIGSTYSVHFLVCDMFPLATDNNMKSAVAKWITLTNAASRTQYNWLQKAWDMLF